MPKGSRAETNERGPQPIFTDIRLVRGKKSYILVEGDSESVKHGTCFNISIISSQLGGEARVGVFFLSETSSIGTASPEAFLVAGPASFPPTFFLPASFFAVGVLLGLATFDGGTAIGGTSLVGSS